MLTSLQAVSRRQAPPAVLNGLVRLLMALALCVAFVASPAAARERADGAPGARPTWSPPNKQACGTSATRASPVWFTLRERELTEVYFPDVRTPAVRGMELAVSRPGAITSVDRETAVGVGVVERLDGLNSRQTVTDRAGRWRITKTYTTDPGRAAAVVDVRFESLTGERYGLHVLLDPQLDADGRDDRARTIGDDLVAHDRRMTSALSASPAFTATTSGYAGTSEPWNDLRDDGSLDGELDARSRGNVRQAATIPLDGVTAQRATLALAFGRTAVSARDAAARALAAGFEALAAENAAGWARYRATLKPAPAAAAPVLAGYETSLLMLAAHADKRDPAAGALSPRDLYHVATARLAAGDTQAAIDHLEFLLREAQRPDGRVPRRRPTGTAMAIDEQALPIVLAWQLQRFEATTWRRLRRNAELIVGDGPRRRVIAVQIAALVCAADVADHNGDSAAAARYERIADRWQRGVQVVDASALELVLLGVKRHDDPLVLEALDALDRRLRSQPILDGRRGEYELLAGRPAGTYLQTLADAANQGGMLPRHVSGPSPYAPSHAQLVRLAWSIDAGAPVGQPSIVACRYVRRCP